MQDDSDELANTATAPPDPSAPAKPAAPLADATLGRYRLERKLGEGGMGVVYAAFDPDLERRVALKVLRADDGGTPELRQRLLREARAMARVTHPNVVVVHEVGNARSRDYIATELIDGDTLSEWLRATRRPEPEIMAAFLAAGRGLAAAHAAGLVHRDFKPHNVLRGRDGRIVVTDFGLARGVDAVAAAAPDPMEATVEVPHGGAALATSSNTPSALSGLTMTGSVLGTPAYMAPEQWSAAKTIGPAADQFAFCVALWEALVGERPYRGDSIDQLKAAVARGPAALDATKLPRPLRKPILRGLDPDPAKRWPDMAALLAQLVRAPRRAVALGVGGGLAATGAIVLAIASHAGGRDAAVAAKPACPLPARGPDAVWPAGASAAMAAARGPDLAKIVDADVAAYRTARAAACAAGEPAKGACLDAALARTDAILQALPANAPMADATLGLFVAPSACGGGVTPRLVTPSADMVAALKLYVASHPSHDPADEAPAAALAARPNIDPCARTIALLALDQITTDVPRGKQATLDAMAAAEQCGDDRLRADAALAEYPYESEQPTVGPRGIAALQKAKVAVMRVAQPDLVARIDETRAAYAAEQMHWTEAFTVGQAAVDGYAARGRTRAMLRAIETMNGMRMLRNDVGDMADARASVAKWRPAVEALHDPRMLAAFDTTDAYARLFLGDIATAHADILRLYQPMPRAPGVPSVTIDGTVVDEQGKPVADATVAIGMALFVDPVGPLPFGRGIDFHPGKTDASGHFTIADTTPGSMIVAQRDPHHRSVPTRAEPHVKLVLRATRRIAGKAALAPGSATTRTFAMAAETNSKDIGRFMWMSPISPDGTYALEGVSTSEVKVGVATWGAALSSSVEFTTVPAGTTDITNMTLSTPRSARTLDVLARSSTASPFESAEVFAFPGKHAFKLSGELNSNHHLGALQMRFASPIVGENVPVAVAKLTKPGDLYARFTDLRDGDITVCVIGLNIDLSDPVASAKLDVHRDELELSCVTPDPKATAIVIEAPPQKRFD